MHDFCRILIIGNLYKHPNQQQPMPTKDQVIEVLKQIHDPEIQVDIWTMGLIRNVEIDNKTVNILMTLTTPTCPYGPMLLEEIRNRVKEEADAKEVDLEVTFEPPWEPSEELRMMLGV
jgi:metal-sulfur cluster biosynthetic enzyme